MTKLTLNDGTEIPDGYAIENSGALMVFIPGMALADGFALLNNPENTSRIRAEQYGQETTFSGFNHLYSLREESGGLLSAGIRKK